MVERFFLQAAICAPIAFAWIAEAGRANAQEYDDPAVAICETVLKSELPAGATYTRSSARIDGKTAVIDYELSILNTRPVAETKRCEFVLADGKFNLRRHVPLKPDCQPEIAALDSATRGKGSVSEARAALVTCNDQLKRDLAIMTDELVDREMPLIMTGIYPIPADRTDLKAISN